MIRNGTSMRGPKTEQPAYLLCNSHIYGQKIKYLENGLTYVLHMVHKLVLKQTRESKCAIIYRMFRLK